MTNMVNKAQGLGLNLITKIAGSDLLDQFKLRKFIERSLYQGSKAGFKTLSATQKPLNQIQMCLNKDCPTNKNRFLI